MAQFEKENIKNLSKLCRIEMSEEELTRFQEEIGKVLGYIEQLAEVDVAHLTPYSHIEEQGIDLIREDTIKESLPREEFLDNAPKHVGGMIAVPPVMKNG